MAINEINKIIEHVIETTNIVKYNKNNKSVDFNIHDVVSCSYMKGLFRVIGYSSDNGQDCVCVTKIGQTYEVEAIDPKFLEKTKIDEKILKVLY